MSDHEPMIRRYNSGSQDAVLSTTHTRTREHLPVTLIRYSTILIDIAGLDRGCCRISHGNRGRGRSGIGDDDWCRLTGYEWRRPRRTERPIGDD